MTDNQALRASIEQRLANLAAERQTSLDRLRRHFAFQRILVRLSADETWVLKGGFALEVRLGLQARATKDLDLRRWMTSMEPKCKTVCSMPSTPTPTTG